jgi:hypothetical protein
MPTKLADAHAGFSVSAMIRGETAGSRGGIEVSMMLKEDAALWLLVAEVTMAWWRALLQ